MFLPQLNPSAVQQNLINVLESIRVWSGFLVLGLIFSAAALLFLIPVGIFLANLHSSLATTISNVVENYLFHFWVAGAIILTLSLPTIILPWLRRKVRS